VKSGLRPGQTVLVQGASGGVATALIVLGRAAGYRVWVTGRSERSGPPRSPSERTRRSSPARGCPSGWTA
jgi:NAD(P)-dependent dehydrogenase (short-subunit alcohol dehydrogenase family)